MEDTVYYRQAKLLLRILPVIARYPIFALKGGTAINFFIRDLPRLSVDIDLTYTPVDDRETALAAISDALGVIEKDIERLVRPAAVMRKAIEGKVMGLVIRADGALVKIEPNPVLRGTIYEPQALSVTPRVQDEFAMSVKTRVLAMEDLYGGKICAALDRQHPRDLFDVKLLFENEGITDSIRKSFIVHLISHDRPMSELLDPTFQDLKEIYENEFKGMTFVKTSLEELEAARTNLVRKIRENLTGGERRFILSVKHGEPQWELLGLDGIDLLPAVKWKLLNISRMGRTKHESAIRKLEKCLTS
ncbi:MAG: nucleotidyl transferase AbiEii/AbiGii toxin family protein [Syntrophorhabdaceae bacterium]|nr:nucleotidyl transferase AbiEii/AbiGii toxin family protein [Syntrophorhabdaceae bacterium]